MFQDRLQKPAKPEATSAGEGYTTAHTAQTTVEGLAQRFERLSLVCQALWEILRDRHSMSEDELKMKVLEVDLRDGTTDGKMATEVLLCPSCGNKTNSKRSVCIICGAQIPKRHVFEI